MMKTPLKHRIKVQIFWEGHKMSHFVLILLTISKKEIFSSFMDFSQYLNFKNPLSEMNPPEFVVVRIT